MLDSYCKTLRIEALTMIDMCRKQIMPAASRYGADLCRAALDKRSLSPEIDAGYETELCARLSSMNALLGRRVEQLERELGAQVRTVDVDGGAFCDALFPWDQA